MMQHTKVLWSLVLFFSLFLDSSTSHKFKHSIGSILFSAV